MSKEPSTPFLGLFECGDKRELRRYCHDLIVSRVDLALFILSCEAEALPFVHHIHYQDRIPTNLRPSTDELAALGGGVVGKPLRGDALKAVKKIGQMFVDRRYFVGHPFLARDDPSHWHFLYLDQRDIAASGNHWTEGPHVHFVNWLWPGHSADSVWKAFRSGQAPGGALHIRFGADRLPEPTD